MTTMRVVGECFFWYRLTRVFPDKFHRAVKRLCVCVCLDLECLSLDFGLGLETPRLVLGLGLEALGIGFSLEEPSLDNKPAVMPLYEAKSIN